MRKPLYHYKVESIRRGVDCESPSIGLALGLSSEKSTEQYDVSLGKSTIFSMGTLSRDYDKEAEICTFYQ